MKPLPESQESLLIRTDFSDEAAWLEVRAAVQAQNGYGFQAYLDFVDDPAYGNLTIERLVDLASQSSYRDFVFLVDRTTLTHPERPVLVVDLIESPGRTFRVIPDEMWGVENSLSIANCDWEDFADHVDEDGIFRGYPDETT